jgi:hypothetical protein
MISFKNREKQLPIVFDDMRLIVCPQLCCEAEKEHD